jgi:hypothetical protein
VFGAVDPNSGSATMLEVARGFGQLNQERLETTPHDHSLQLGRRRIRVDRLDGMGGRKCG